jgi:hypothetical protein
MRALQQCRHTPSGIEGDRQHARADRVACARINKLNVLKTPKTPTAAAWISILCVVADPSNQASARRVLGMGNRGDRAGGDAVQDADVAQGPRAGRLQAATH